MLLISFLIIITDPYKNIDYDKINVYEIENRYNKIIIKVHCSYGHNDCNNNSIDIPIEDYEPIYTPKDPIFYIFR